MEVSLEYKGARRPLRVTRDTVISAVVEEMKSLGAKGPVVRLAGGSQEEGSTDYLLQRWVAKWQIFVDVCDLAQIVDDDRLTVALVQRTPPPQGLLGRLCCCCGGRQRGLGNERVKKDVDEDQEMEYRLTAPDELSATSDWESEARSEASSVANITLGRNISESPTPSDEEGTFVRADTGRASWKLVPHKEQLSPRTTSASSDHDSGSENPSD